MKIQITKFQNSPICRSESLERPRLATLVLESSHGDKFTLLTLWLVILVFHFLIGAVVSLETKSPIHGFGQDFFLYKETHKHNKTSFLL